MAGSLYALTADAWQPILQRVHLRDLAALAASCRALRTLVDGQPEATWQAAAACDPGESCLQCSSKCWLDHP